MKLQKCPSCNEYTLKEKCEKCKTKKPTKSAHYKFLNLKDAPNDFTRKRKSKR